MEIRRGDGELMEPTTWTIKRCLDWTRDYLRDKGEQKPRYIAEWMLSTATGLDRVGIYTNFERPLEQDELGRMHEYVVRRAKGEPVQYVLGKAPFRMIEVACEPPILIPRPETEMLVEEVLSYLDREILGGVDAGGRDGRPRVELPWNSAVEEARLAEEAERARRVAESDAGVGDGAADEAAASADGEAAELPSDAGADAAGPADSGAHGAPGDSTPVTDGDSAGTSRVARVLEVGTGTGCIPLSLATERPGKVVCVATDVDPRAIDLATRNRDELGIDEGAVEFRQGDLVTPVRSEERRTFDVLVSNPPYIPSGVVDTLGSEVRDFESRGALDGGDDGLDIFRRLVRAAPYMLRLGGLFACELFETRVEAAARICRESGMTDVRVVEDLTGRPRFVVARVM